MKVYMVFMEKKPEDIKSAVVDFIELDSNVWIVASDLKTSSEVTEALGIGDGNRGIVTKFTEYYGFHNKSIWQKVEAWKDEDEKA